MRVCFCSRIKVFRIKVADSHTKKSERAVCEVGLDEQIWKKPSRSEGGREGRARERLGERVKQEKWEFSERRYFNYVVSEW